MNVKITSEYLEVIYAFMAKNDVRYYLNGFHVKPHPEKGIILSSTDGHRAVIIHDENGFSDGDYILPISKDLIREGKKVKCKNGGMPINSISYIDNKVFVAHCDDDIFLNEHSDNIELAVSHVEYFTAIDGRFPDVGRIVRDIKFKKTDIVGVNANYIGDLKVISRSKKFPVIKIMLQGVDGAVVAVSGFNNEIVAIVMPARIEEKEAFKIPEFALIAGNQNKEPT